MADQGPQDTEAQKSAQAGGGVRSYGRLESTSSSASGRVFRVSSVIETNPLESNAISNSRDGELSSNRSSQSLTMYGKNSASASASAPCLDIPGNGAKRKSDNEISRIFDAPASTHYDFKPSPGQANPGIIVENPVKPKDKRSGATPLSPVKTHVASFEVCVPDDSDSVSFNQDKTPQKIATSDAQSVDNRARSDQRKIFDTSIDQSDSQSLNASVFSEQDSALPILHTNPNLVLSPTITAPSCDRLPGIEMLGTAEHGQGFLTNAAIGGPSSAPLNGYQSATAPGSPVSRNLNPNIPFYAHPGLMSATLGSRFTPGVQPSYLGQRLSPMNPGFGYGMGDFLVDPITGRPITVDRVGSQGSYIRQGRAANLDSPSNLGNLASNSDAFSHQFNSVDFTGEPLGTYGKNRSARPSAYGDGVSGDRYDSTTSVTDQRPLRKSRLTDLKYREEIWKDRTFRFLEMPRTNLAMAYHCIVLSIVIAIQVILVFRSTQTFGEWVNTIQVVLQYTLAIILIIEYPLRLWSCTVMISNRGVKNLLKYMVTPLMLIDLLAVCQSLYTISTDLGADLTLWGDLVRIILLMRVLRMERKKGTVQTLPKVLKQHADEIKFFALLVVIIILLAATLEYHIEFSEGSGFTNLGQGLWYAVVSATTVGYGDIYPETPWGKVVAMAFLFTVTSMMAIAPGIVGTAFALQYEDKKKTKKRNKRIKALAARLIQLWYLDMLRLSDDDRLREKHKSLLAARIMRDRAGQQVKQVLSERGRAVTSTIQLASILRSNTRTNRRDANPVTDTDITQYIVILQFQLRLSRTKFHLSRGDPEVTLQAVQAMAGRSIVESQLARQELRGYGVYLHTRDQLMHVRLSTIEAKLDAIAAALKIPPENYPQASSTVPETVINPPSSSSIFQPPGSPRSGAWRGGVGSKGNLLTPNATASGKLKRVTSEGDLPLSDPKSNHSVYC